eukprot:4924786-Amphidinium_carterae.2
MSQEDIEQILSIQEQPVTSMILGPKEGPGLVVWGHSDVPSRLPRLCVLLSLLLSFVATSHVPSMRALNLAESEDSGMAGALSELDDITVRGLAWSGGGRGIVRVDVTADDGNTWHTAELKAFLRGVKKD